MSEKRLGETRPAEEVQKIDEAITFALTERGFDPAESHPIQTHACQATIKRFGADTEYDPSTLTPVEELALMAYCRLIGREIPPNLRWEWEETTLEKIETLGGTPDDAQK